jgi:hypothetical protein
MSFQSFVFILFAVLFFFGFCFMPKISDSIFLVLPHPRISSASLTVAMSISLYLRMPISRGFVETPFPHFQAASAFPFFLREITQSMNKIRYPQRYQKAMDRYEAKISQEKHQQVRLRALMNRDNGN